MLTANNSPDKLHFNNAEGQALAQPANLHNEYMKSFFYPNAPNNSTQTNVDKSDTIS